MNAWLVIVVIIIWFATSLLWLAIEIRHAPYMTPEQERLDDELRRRGQ